MWISDFDVLYILGNPREISKTFMKWWIYKFRCFGGQNQPWSWTRRIKTGLDRPALIWAYLTHVKPKLSMWALFGKPIQIPIWRKSIGFEIQSEISIMEGDKPLEIIWRHEESNGIIYGIIHEKVGDKESHFRQALMNHTWLKNLNNEDLMKNY